MNFITIKKHLCVREHHQQSAKATHRTHNTEKREERSTSLASLIRDKYPKCAENPQLDNKKAHRFKKRQRTQRDVSAKKTYTRSTGACQDAQRHESLGKHKPNSRSIDSCPSGWSRSEKPGEEDWKPGAHRYLHAHVHRDTLHKRRAKRRRQL